MQWRFLHRKRSRLHSLQFFLQPFCVDNKFSTPTVVYRGENAAYKFIEAILEEYEYCKKVMKKYFNKNLILTEKEEENSWSSNTCWICEKLIEHYQKVRDHCHITKKYRGVAYWSCNVNLKLTKKVFIIFHDIKSYDRLSIMNVIGKFNVNIDVIPNGLEKYMAFTIKKKLVFIDSKQFMYSSLEKLVKNLSDDDFKHLT